ncbi:MAG: hypothetical protein WC365_06300 [Candidatus Babeliales bacterium]|jgi:hypothetical protein
MEQSFYVLISFRELRKIAAMSPNETLRLEDGSIVRSNKDGSIDIEGTVDVDESDFQRESMYNEGYD